MTYASWLPESARAALPPLVGLVVVISGLAFVFWPESTVRYPAGILVPDEPYQEDLAETPAWTHGDYMVTGLAEFTVRAKVLSRERYRLDAESDLSPIDFALGWGPMSDQSIVDEFDISQGYRWYEWETDTMPIPQIEVTRHSANMHIIPATEEIEDVLLSVKRGEVIELSGYLVQVEGDGGWLWKSSLTRGDSGGGACEVVWVDGVIRNPADLAQRPL